MYNDIFKSHVQIIIILINMVRVQYPMQFIGCPRNNSNPCSTTTTKVHAFHALLLTSKHQIMIRVPYLLYGRRPGHT